MFYGGSGRPWVGHHLVILGYQLLRRTPTPPRGWDVRQEKLCEKIKFPSSKVKKSTFSRQFFPNVSYLFSFLKMDFLILTWRELTSYCNSELWDYPGTVASRLGGNNKHIYITGQWPIPGILVYCRWPRQPQPPVSVLAFTISRAVTLSKYSSYSDIHQHYLPICRFQHGVNFNIL